MRCAHGTMTGIVILRQGCSGVQRSAAAGYVSMVRKETFVSDTTMNPKIHFHGSVIELDAMHNEEFLKTRNILPNSTHSLVLSAQRALEFLGRAACVSVVNFHINVEKHGDVLLAHSVGP